MHIHVLNMLMLINCIHIYIYMMDNDDVDPMDNQKSSPCRLCRCQGRHIFGGMNGMSLG